MPVRVQSPRDSIYRFIDRLGMPPAVSDAFESGEAPPNVPEVMPSRTTLRRLCPTRNRDLLNCIGAKAVRKTHRMAETAPDSARPAHTQRSYGLVTTRT